MLFDKMSSNFGILYLYGETIIDINNEITYNGQNMLEIEVNITWKMLQIRISQAIYISIPIYSDRNVKSMFEFASINGIKM